VEQFVGYNSDVAYNDKNFAKGELNDSLDAIMFNAQPGVVYGPYLEDNSYKMARLYKIVNIPDSVKARHILIRPAGQTQADMAKAKSVADSLKNLIEKGADFAELARNNSADRSNADKGGDLGWFKEGLMVKAFNDAAFEAEKGKTKVVESNFGVHILQVTDRGKEIKKVKVAFIERKIDASSETYSKIYNNAVRFSENTTYEAFNKAIASQKLAKQYASIGESDRAIMGLESPRPVIRWAYNAKEKAISEPLDLGKKYVVAALVLIKEKGTAPMEIVKNEVELAVRKQKKAEKLTEKINGALQGAATLEVLASRLKTNVESETGIAFSSFSLTTAGIEPRVIAEATNIQQGKLSGAIEGTNGVYVILVKNIVQPEAIKDYTATLTRINGTFQSRATYDGLGALRKLANIEDKRKKFY
jgi:peptidyl-prolyl cis-trans isomerase D